MDKTVRCGSFAALVLMAVAAAGQEAPEASDGQASDTAREPPVLEELTVTADRPLGMLREELRDAENAFYAAFNELIDDPKFRIECAYVRPTGSQISERRCQPAYVREAQHEATQMALHGVTGTDDPGTVEFSGDTGLIEFSGNPGSRIALLRNHMLQVMTDTIQNDPALMQLFLEYRRSQMALESALSE